MRTITSLDPDKPEAHVTVTKGLSGYFAVHVWWNPEGFYEPWDTGIGRYDNLADAREEAQFMAEENDLPYMSEGHPE